MHQCKGGKKEKASFNFLYPFLWLKGYHEYHLMTLATAQVVDDYYSFILHFIAQIKVWIHSELMVHSVFFYFIFYFFCVANITVHET